MKRYIIPLTALIAAISAVCVFLTVRKKTQCVEQGADE